MALQFATMGIQVLLFHSFKGIVSRDKYYFEDLKIKLVLSLRCADGLKVFSLPCYGQNRIKSFGI
jgi:hypothetical protein